MCFSQHIKLYVSYVYLCDMFGLLCVLSTLIMALFATVNLKDVIWIKLLVQCNFSGHREPFRNTEQLKTSMFNSTLRHMCTCWLCLRQHMHVPYV